ncbi:hypothetical protein [Streptomyces sp. NPDC002467]|uniref:phage tail protein n=1 Tax=Streptomyces sp. NPDC002467 TaxID=3364647 RepID=UPI00367BFBEC
MAVTVGELVANIDADTSGMERGLAAAELQMRGFTQDAEGRLRRLDGTFASHAERVEQGFARNEESSRRFGFSLGRLGGLAGGLGSVAGTLGKIGAALGTAVPLVAGLGATLVQIAPAAGVAVTGLIAVQLAAKALKIGMKGVGDAVSAALDPSDPEAYAEALKKLSPNARDFVKEIRNLQPQFKAIQQGVQDALFEDFGQLMKDLGEHTLPILGRGLKDAATTLNLMGQSAANAALDLSLNGTLGKAINGANAGLSNLTQAPGQFITALTQIGAAAGPAFARMTGAAATGLDTLSQKLTHAFDSGAMQTAIEDAVTVFKQLFEVVRNVGSIVGSVFSAARTTGGDFLGVLTQITGALAEAFASPAVQGALKAIYSTMALVSQTVGPLLISVLQAIAPLFTALGPPVQRLVAALGQALGPIIAALGPVLEAVAVAVGALMDAIAPLLPVIGSLIAQLLPALTPLLALVAGIFKALAPLVEQLAGILMSALAPILAALVPVLQPIVDALLTLVRAVMPIISAQVAAFAPIIAKLAQMFAELLVALAPVIEQLILLVADILTAITPLIIPVIGFVSKLASVFADELGQVIREVIVPAFMAIAALLRGDFSAAWDYAKQMVRGILETWTRIFRDLPNRAWEALGGLASALWSRIQEAGSRLVEGARQKAGELLDRIRAIPGQARDALGDLGSMLWNAGARLIGGFIDGIRSKVSAIRNTLSGITDMLPDWKGPAAVDARILTPAGRSLIEGFQRGITDQTPALQRQLGGLTGALPGMTLGPSGGATVGGMGPGRLIIEVTGPDEVKAFIRKIVAVDGRGDVQTAFG